MILLAAGLAFGWLAAWRAPETPIGDRSHRHLVARPAAWFNRFGRRHLVMGLAVALLLLGAAWLGHDALTIVAMGSPDLLALFGSVEMGVWLDVAVGVALSWTAAKTAGLMHRPSRRGQRARRRRVVQRPANDDEGRRRDAA